MIENTNQVMVNIVFHVNLLQEHKKKTDIALQIHVQTKTSFTGMDHVKNVRKEQHQILHICVALKFKLKHKKNVVRDNGKMDQDAWNAHNIRGHKLETCIVHQITAKQGKFGLKVGNVKLVNSLLSLLELVNHVSDQQRNKLYLNLNLKLK